MKPLEYGKRHDSQLTTRPRFNKFMKIKNIQFFRRFAKLGG